MKIFSRKIAKLKCGWNEVELDEEAFHRLCSDRKIRVEFLPLRGLGFYSCSGKGKHYIAIDSRLSKTQSMFVMFHEFAHYLMHSPSTDAITTNCGRADKPSRDEQEADAFAFCAMLPLKLLETRDGEEVAGIYGTRFFMERLNVYERYGI